MKSKPKTRKKKSPQPRRRPKKKESGMLSSKSLPAGAFILGAAILALLTAFHFNHERLAPKHAPVASAAPDVNLGR